MTLPDESRKKNRRTPPSLVLQLVHDLKPVSERGGVRGVDVVDLDRRMRVDACCLVPAHQTDLVATGVVGENDDPPWFITSVSPSTRTYLSRSASMSRTVMIRSSVTQCSVLPWSRIAPNAVHHSS